jgi:hypothetical protein
MLTFFLEQCSCRRRRARQTHVGASHRSGSAGGPAPRRHQCPDCRSGGSRDRCLGGLQGRSRNGGRRIDRSARGNRDAAMTARAPFASEITRLRRHVANAEARITELDRGRRVARASEAVRAWRRSGIEAASPYESTLPEAENTLRRLRERKPRPPTRH